MGIITNYTTDIDTNVNPGFNPIPDYSPQLAPPGIHTGGRYVFIIQPEICIKVKDITDPVVECIESVNPHGKTIPPAGSTTLPGPKGGKNEDGFYELLAEDNCDPEPDIYVTYVGSGNSMLFGPFTSGTVVKITQAPGATPSAKKMGSSNGQAGAVSYHITVPDDPIVWVVDDSGNRAWTECFVPPPPK